MQLYEELLYEIKQLKHKKMSQEDLFQHCFEVACNYKDALNRRVRIYEFGSSEDEIFYFKKIKPLFNAEIEYYVFCYHVVLFKTSNLENDKEELEAYYKRQLNRMDRFRKDNKEFYNYVVAESSCADKAWFTRHNGDEENSLFDRLMGTYLAIQKFEIYISELIGAKTINNNLD
jgi:hypothetical protein